MSKAGRKLRRHNLFVGRTPLPTVSAWIEANRSRFRPGEVAEIVVEHDASCRYPAGAPCTCRSGPSIRIAGDEPGDN